MTVSQLEQWRAINEDMLNDTSFVEIYLAKRFHEEIEFEIKLREV